jgi:hypothetical protein
VFIVDVTWLVDDVYHTRAGAIVTEPTNYMKLSKKITRQQGNK